MTEAVIICIFKSIQAFQDFLLLSLSLRVDVKIAEFPLSYNGYLAKKYSPILRYD